MSKAKSLYKHAHVPVGKSLTKQDGAQTPADVWRKYQAGQPIPDAPPPQYGDISEWDYEQHRNQLAAFETAFQELPAHFRDRFDNDAAQYADFLGENEEKIASDGVNAVLREENVSEETEAQEPGTGVSAQTESGNDESPAEETI